MDLAVAMVTQILLDKRLTTKIADTNTKSETLGENNLPYVTCIGTILRPSLNMPSLDMQY